MDRTSLRTTELRHRASEALVGSDEHEARFAPGLTWVAVALLWGAAACAESTTPSPDAASGDGNTGDGDTTAPECTVPADCVVVPQSCCGTCGVATRGDAIAIPRSRASSHRSEVCRDEMACPACAGLSDPTLLATCRAGRCELVDLLDDPALTGCEVASDCRIRTVDCCECGGRTSRDAVVALRADAESAFSALVCDGSGVACAECAPVYPPEAMVSCDAERRRCTLSWAR